VRIQNTGDSLPVVFFPFSELGGEAVCHFDRFEDAEQLESPLLLLSETMIYLYLHSVFLSNQILFLNRRSGLDVTDSYEVVFVLTDMTCRGGGFVLGFVVLVCNALDPGRVLERVNGFPVDGDLLET
jgi:hypothetical protein